ncbi:MAG: hypothetical protein AAF770_01190 [Bacteroidota bacterium]
MPKKLLIAEEAITSSRQELKSQEYGTLLKRPRFFGFSTYTATKQQVTSSTDQQGIFYLTHFTEQDTIKCQRYEPTASPYGWVASKDFQAVINPV